MVRIQTVFSSMICIATDSPLEPKSIPPDDRIESAYKRDMCPLGCDRSNQVCL